MRSVSSDKANPQTWSHDALGRDLVGHLRQNTEILAWEDMQLGPSGSARPDVYVIPKSFANFRPLVYEIKVSVSDFRSDVTSGKWQKYLDYACGVIFAVPAGLIGKDDVPAGCGLIVRHENVWRTVKKPTLTRLDNMPRDAWIKLLIDGTRREAERERIHVRQRAAGSWSAEQQLRKRHGSQVANLVARAMRSAERVEEQIKQNEQHAEKLRQDRNNADQIRREEAARERKYLDADLRNLASVLGLAPDCSQEDLGSAVRDAVRRLASDAEVCRLRRLLDQVLRAAKDAAEPLPGEHNQIEARARLS